MSTCGDKPGRCVYLPGTYIQGELMNKNQNPKKSIWKSYVNSYKYLYDDAELFHRLSKTDDIGFKCTQYCRTSIILYILALEGLINRAIGYFLKDNDKIRKFIVGREKDFTLLDKWEMLPLFFSKGQKSFDKSTTPWNYLKELVNIRNDFVYTRSIIDLYFTGSILKIVLLNNLYSIKHQIIWRIQTLMVKIK